MKINSKVEKFFEDNKQLIITVIIIIFVIILLNPVIKFIKSIFNPPKPSGNDEQKKDVLNSLKTDDATITEIQAESIADIAYNILSNGIWIGYDALHGWKSHYSQRVDELRTAFSVIKNASDANLIMKKFGTRKDKVTMIPGLWDWHTSDAMTLPEFIAYKVDEPEKSELKQIFA